MLRYNYVRRVLLLIAMISVSWAPASSQETRLQDRAEGRSQIVPTWFEFRCTSDLNTNRVTATGDATHIGHWTAAGQVNSVDFDPAADHVTINAEITIITANGDKLYGSVSIYSRISTGQGIDTITFTGGTGRYAGASGCAILFCTVTEDPDSPMVYHCQCTGPGVLLLARR